MKNIDLLLVLSGFLFIPLIVGLLMLASIHDKPYWDSVARHNGSCTSR